MHQKGLTQQAWTAQILPTARVFSTGPWVGSWGMISEPSESRNPPRSSEYLPCVRCFIHSLFLIFKIAIVQRYSHLSSKSKKIQGQKGYSKLDMQKEVKPIIFLSSKLMFFLMLPFFFFLIKFIGVALINKMI